MPYATTAEVLADVEAVHARLTETLGLVQTTDDAFTEADAENLRAGLDGVRSDALAILRELDTTDEADLQVIADGAVRIGIWRWRRAVRRALLDLAGQALAAQDVAREIAAGTPEKVVVSREGDTLQRIAARELGSWEEWPRLLAANPGVAVGELPSGTTLVIPERR